MFPSMNPEDETTHLGEVAEKVAGDERKVAEKPRSPNNAKHRELSETEARLGKGATSGGMVPSCSLGGEHCSRNGDSYPRKPSVYPGNHPGIQAAIRWA